MRREEEGGMVVAVLEKRAVDVRREGYFIVQVSRGQRWENAFPHMRRNPVCIAKLLLRLTRVNVSQAIACDSF